MRISRFLALVGLVTALFFSVGCPTVLAPKTSALQHVHELYREEFMLLDAPAQAANDSKAPASGAAFARSLNAIHDYRLSYPQESQELAHLQVLEGMIYLQARRFGLAAAVKEQVKEAGRKLVSALGTEKAGGGAAAVQGKLVRDSLLAKNFEHLLTGWSETRADNPRLETFEKAADQLIANLKGLSPNQRTELQRDDGALYIATSAAIFYAWASTQEQLQSTFDSDPVKAIARAERKKKRNEKSRDIIGEFLTNEEKAADISKDVSGSVVHGRLRYVMWYHYLNSAKPDGGPL